MERNEVEIRELREEDLPRVKEFVSRIQAEMSREEQGKQIKLLLSHPAPYVLSGALILLLGIPLHLPVAALSGFILMSIFFLLKVRFQTFWKKVSVIFSGHGEDLQNLKSYYLDEKYRRKFLVAEYNNNIVGTVAIREHSREDPTTAKLWRMFVDFNCRRLGIGSKLAERIFVEAKTLQYSTIKLRTHSTNTSAVEFYERQGFKYSEETVFASVYPSQLIAVNYEKILED